MQIVELFSGIGGVAEAVRRWPQVSIAAAVDIDQTCNLVYQANHVLIPRCQTLESVQRLPSGSMWWLSPPCQPYTQRGEGRGENDPRSAALANLIEVIDSQRPEMIALENVPKFAGSFHHRKLALTLKQAGYAIQDHALCPTQWAVPMRRARFYLRACRNVDRLQDIDFKDVGKPLSHYVSEHAWDDPRLKVSPLMLEQYASALNIVDVDDAHATTACFTSAYGKSPVRAGSYLRCRRRKAVRRFSPHEIARLMGYRDDFYWPEEFSLRDQYRMIGNALSVTVTARVIESLLASRGSQ